METEEEIVFWGCDKCSCKGILCEDCVHNPILLDNYSPIEDDDDTEDEDELDTDNLDNLY